MELSIEDIRRNYKQFSDEKLVKLAESKAKYALAIATIKWQAGLRNWQ